MYVDDIVSVCKQPVGSIGNYSRVKSKFKKDGPEN